VAVVAAHREITEHHDPVVALGSPPAPGQPELFASWRAACRALGREEAAREEAELSNGQLRLRVRAWAREQVWAPAYVADELAATCRAAESHRASAVLLQAEADSGTAGPDVHRLRNEARDSAALAEALDLRATALREADHARALWFAHTAATRVAGERAADELDRRRLEATVEPDVTAEEWLELHRQATLREERARDIRTADLADGAEVPERPGAAFNAAQTDLTGWVDLTSGPPAPIGPLDHAQGADQLSATLTRVPSAEETATVLALAREALRTLAARESLDREREASEAHVRICSSYDASERDANASAFDVLERKEI
jgi:hypothetical protein